MLRTLLPSSSNLDYVDKFCKERKKMRLSYFPTLDRFTGDRGFCSQAGRQEVPGSTPDHACRPSCSEFSVVFSKFP